MVKIKEGEQTGRDREWSEGEIEGNICRKREGERESEGLVMCVFGVKLTQTLLAAGNEILYAGHRERYREREGNVEP